MVVHETCVCRSCKIKLESAIGQSEHTPTHPVKLNRTLIVLNSRVMTLRRLAREQEALKAIRRVNA